IARSLHAYRCWHKQPACTSNDTRHRTGPPHLFLALFHISSTKPPKYGLVTHPVSSMIVLVTPEACPRSELVLKSMNQPPPLAPGVIRQPALTRSTSCS